MKWEPSSASYLNFSVTFRSYLITSSGTIKKVKIACSGKSQLKSPFISREGGFNIMQLWAYIREFLVSQGFLNSRAISLSRIFIRFNVSYHCIWLTATWSIIQSQQVFVVDCNYGINRKYISGLLQLIILNKNYCSKCFLLGIKPERTTNKAFRAFSF